MKDNKAKLLLIFPTALTIISILYFFYPGVESMLEPYKESLHVQDIRHTLSLFKTITNSNLRPVLGLSGSNATLFQSTGTKESEATTGANDSLINKWSVFENTINNFKVSYPSNWKRVSIDNNVTFYSPIKNRNDSFQENVLINTSPSANTPLDRLVSLALIEYRQSKEDFRLIESGVISISENPAYKTVYTYRTGNDLYKALEIKTTTEGKLYSIIFTARLDEYYNYLTTMNRVLDSIDIQRLVKQPLSTEKYPKLIVAIDPYEMVADPNTDNLYITNFRIHSLSVVDETTDKVKTEIKVGRFPASVDVNPELSTIYVANSRSNNVSVIDASSNTVVKDIAVGNRPVSVVLDNIEKGIDSLAFVANHESNTISVIDGTKNELISPALSVGTQPNSIAINEVTNRLYVANSGSNTVTVIEYYISNDGKLRNMTLANIKVQKYPYDLAINPVTNKIYVSNYYSDTVSIIDGATNAVNNTLKVGNRPTGVAINPVANKIYISNYGNATVSVIDGTTDQLLVNIPVGNFPYEVYHDPKTHIIYVINLGSRSISQIKDTSLLAGIRFMVNPSDSGQVYCNGKVISDGDYERYVADSEIKCRAESTSDYVFRSWSANVPLESSTSSETSFKSSDYGNVTANFQVPVEINLPWDQLYILIVTILVPTIIGWSLPAAISYINSRRQRKVLGIFMGKIAQIDKSTNDDKQRRNELLKDARSEITGKLAEGKISESQYEILNDKISDLLNNDSGHSS